MATTKRRQLTDEERAQRRRREQELTERAVAQLRCSDGWQRWLRSVVASGCAATACLSRGPVSSTLCNGAAAVDDMSLLAVGPSVAASPGSACERAAVAHGPIRTLDARACEPLDVRTTRDVQSLPGNARAGRKPRRSRTPRPRCSGRADVVRSSAVA